MYILVEILHTEFQYISLIEMKKYNRNRKTIEKRGKKKMDTNRDKRSIFFPVPLFLILFLFQLYFCISIKLMYWKSVCKISTNIYIYIVTYIIFILDSFHI